MVLHFDTWGVPDARLIERGVLSTAGLPDDALEVLWDLLARAAPPTA